jgi:hypothetical protein
MMPRAHSVSVNSNSPTAAGWVLVAAPAIARRPWHFSGTTERGHEDPACPFTVTDWSRIEPTVHRGEAGLAYWRTRTIGDIRVRHVEYASGHIED